MTKIRNADFPPVEWLDDHPQLSMASVASKALLVADARPASYARGAFLYREDAPADSCFLIEQGEICLVRYTDQGEEYVRNHFVAGQVVGLPVMFMAQDRHLANARAVAAVQGRWLSRRALLEACQQDGPLALAFLRYTSEMLRQSLMRSYSLAVADCPQRLAEYLVSLHDSQHTEHLTIPLKIGQLAANLGMRSETLSRQFATWRRQGLVSGRGSRLSILDLQRLRAISQP